MHSHQLGEKSRHLVFKLFLENYPTCCCEISQVLTHVSICILSEAFFSATIKKIPDLTVFFVMWLKKEKKKSSCRLKIGLHVFLHRGNFIFFCQRKECLQRCCHSVCLGKTGVRGHIARSQLRETHYRGTCLCALATGEWSLLPEANRQDSPVATGRKPDSQCLYCWGMRACWLPLPAAQGNQSQHRKKNLKNMRISRVTQTRVGKCCVVPPT